MSAEEMSSRKTKPASGKKTAATVKKKKKKSVQETAPEQPKKKKRSVQAAVPEQPEKKKKPVQKTAPEQPEKKPVQKTKIQPVRKKKKKFRLKKNVKLTLFAFCAVAVFCGLMTFWNGKRSSAEEENQNVIEVELPDSLPETTEEPVTETEEPVTEIDENAPFIDYNLEIDPDKPMIALTYDDGPKPGSSDEILDVLEEYGAHATFFVVGNNISEETEDIIRREISIGCEVANHSRGHEQLTKLELDEAVASLKACDQKVYDCTGRYPQHVRPPYGAYNDDIRKADTRVFIWWSVETHDWELKNEDKIYNIVMENIDDGDIVLMHDIHQETADASKRLIPDLIEKGYQLVTVSELMYYRGFPEEESMVLFNVHPDTPLYDSMFGTVFQKETDETESDSEETGEETVPSETGYETT